MLVRACVHVSVGHTWQPVKCGLSVAVQLSSPQPEGVGG